MNILDKIESYEFTCDGGPLKLCDDWIALRNLQNLHVVVSTWANTETLPKHTSGAGGWSFTVFTNEQEAANYASYINKSKFGGATIYITKPLMSITKLI